MRQAAFFSDNNYQDYEFTRLNTYKKKEMSEELPKIGSNNNYPESVIRPLRGSVVKQI